MGAFFLFLFDCPFTFSLMTAVTKDHSKKTITRHRHCSKAFMCYEANVFAGVEPSKVAA